MNPLEIIEILKRVDPTADIGEVTLDLLPSSYKATGVEETHHLTFSACNVAYVLPVKALEEEDEFLIHEIGPTVKGPFNEPTEVKNPEEFKRVFGIIKSNKSHTSSPATWKHPELTKTWDASAKPAEPPTRPGYLKFENCLPPPTVTLVNKVKIQTENPTPNKIFVVYYHYLSDPLRWYPLGKPACDVEGAVEIVKHYKESDEYMKEEPCEYRIVEFVAMPPAGNCLDKAYCCVHDTEKTDAC
jgi:hypothetical protein